MASARIKGVLSPVVTPVAADYRPDPGRLIRQCKWLLDQGCGLAVFGTNSEANSFSVTERMFLLDALIEAGVDPGRMMPGTGCCALTDSVELTRHAVNHGCAGTLMLPPFYYKGVSDEGLYRNFSEIVQRIGDTRLRIYLYHIPPVAQVSISIPLIERLIKAYPESIVGMKDSSGDWANTKAVLDAFAPAGFDVFAGSETWLLANMRHGGAGCISATANVNPAAIVRLYHEWRNDDAESQQATLDELRGVVAKYPMIPALKQIIAYHAGDPEWARVRPPLVELPAVQAEALISELAGLTFRMPGIRDPLRSPEHTGQLR